MTFEEQMDQVQQDYQFAAEKALQAEVERLKGVGLGEDEAAHFAGVKLVKWLKKLEAEQS